MNAFVFLSSLFLSLSAFADSGHFYCETQPGNRDFDGIYFSGKLDGEAQVTDLVINLAEGDGIETPLKLISISLDVQFELAAVHPLEDDSILITIQSSPTEKKSPAIFEIRNGEEVRMRKGFCSVQFRAGI